MLTLFLFADEADISPLRPATRHHSIASRVSLDESRRSTPPIPPGFEPHLANESRRPTPTIPPGLTRPNALPDLEGSSSRPGSRPSSRASIRRQTSQILPAVPLRPGTPAKPAASSKLDKTLNDEWPAIEGTPTKTSRIIAPDVKQAIPAAQEVKVSESEHTPEHADMPENLSKGTVEGAVKALNKEVAKENVAFNQSPAHPELGSGPSPAELAASKGDATADTASNEEPPLVKGRQTDRLEGQKRRHPGKLDITAATDKKDEAAASILTPVENAAPNKQQRIASSSAQTSSTPKLPESPSVASPAVRTAAPRTLRVVQTPKTETPPPISLPTAQLPSVISHRLPSRQPSLASINAPGTPSSEQISISDNISLTSTSLSRANSPPPAGSKVGTAPVRAKTKSQQKKDRQERAKALEEEKAKVEETIKSHPEEPVVEAIVSRKKKEKRAKEPRLMRPKGGETATADTTPTASRPASPSMKVEPSAAKVEMHQPIVEESKPTTPSKQTPPTSQPSQEPSPPPTPTMSPAQLIAELKASAPEIQKCIDSFFRATSGHHFKTPHNISQKDLLAHWKGADFQFNLSKDEVEGLLSGKIPAVYRGEEGRPFDRAMTTPSGAQLRALTQELESRFLELERAIREMPEELRFRPSKPQNATKFPQLDLAAELRKLDNGARGRGPSAMEQMVQDGATMKKGAFLVDEASKYINEFVMPPATPPPSAGGNVVRTGQATGGAQTHAFEQQSFVQSLEVLEKQLNDAKRNNDEKENALKRVWKRNKKSLGLA